MSWSTTIMHSRAVSRSFWSSRSSRLVWEVVAGAIKLLAADKSIPDTNDRLDTGAAAVELLPQAPDVHVQRSRVTEITISPDVIQQLLARGDTARILDQVL